MTCDAHVMGWGSKSSIRANNRRKYKGMENSLYLLLPINATVNSSTGNSNTDTTSGGLVQSPSSNPTATPGVAFDAAKLQKRLYLCKFYLKNFYLQGLHSKIPCTPYDFGVSLPKQFLFRCIWKEVFI